MNHANEIGLTIEDVAWHKAEIFKTGSPAFSMPQVEAGALVESVLRNRAAEKGTSLSFISTATTGESLPANGGVLNVPVQRLNCSLALELVRMFLQTTESGHTMTSDDITTGVKKFSWSGRYEVIQDKTWNCQWFLDGAHNQLSLKIAAEWFATSSKVQSRVLIFAHVSTRHGGPALVESLAHALFEFGAMPQHVIFTTYDRAKVPKAETCAVYSSLWEQFDPEAVVSTELAIDGAIRRAREIANQEGETRVLITSSLFLVGSALSILRP